MNTFTTFQSLQDWLYDKSSFHMELGLERMRRILRSPRLSKAEQRASSGGSPGEVGQVGQVGQPAAETAEGLSYPIIQVLGTNGKGSTSSFLSSLAIAHGLKTGLYTSPHFLSPRERILINGRQLEEQTWLECANAVTASGGENLTYFEFVTVLAALAFQRAGVDLAVFEAGLGGKNDATTALPAQLTVFTPISLDHHLIIGPALADIARDKAAAIRAIHIGHIGHIGSEKSEAARLARLARPDRPDRPGRPLQSQSGVTVVSAAQPEEVRTILQQACEEKKARFVGADNAVLPPQILTSEVKLGLWGKHQFANAALALTAWRCFCAEHGLTSDRDAELQGLREAWIAGRLQWIAPPEAVARKGRAAALQAGQDDESGTPGNAKAAAPGPPIAEGAEGIEGDEGATLLNPIFLLDGAHNPHGLAALGKSLAEAGIRPAACVFTCLADKDAPSMAAHLRVLCPAPVFVPPLPDNPRALPPQELAGIIGLSAIPVGSFSEALQKAEAQCRQILSELPPGQAARHPVLICGSLYLLAEFFKLHPEYLSAQKAARFNPPLKP